MGPSVPRTGAGGFHDLSWRPRPVLPVRRRPAPHPPPGDNTDSRFPPPSARGAEAVGARCGDPIRPLNYVKSPAWISNLHTGGTLAPLSGPPDRKRSIRIPQDVILEARSAIFEQHEDYKRLSWSQFRSPQPTVATRSWAGKRLHASGEFGTSESPSGEDRDFPRFRRRITEFRPGRAGEKPRTGKSGMYVFSYPCAGRPIAANRRIRNYLTFITSYKAAKCFGRALSLE